MSNYYACFTLHNCNHILYYTYVGVPPDLLTMLAKQSEEISQLKQEMKLQNQQLQQQSGKFDITLQILESTLIQCSYQVPR